MVELIVVALEEIEIDDANRERFAGGIGPLLRLFHRGDQRTTIVDARQIIVARLFLDIFQLDARFGKTTLQLLDATANKQESRKCYRHDDDLKHIQAQHFDVAVV